MRYSPECPTVKTSMGSEPRRRASSISEFSGFRIRRREQDSMEVSAGRHTVSGPPELRLFNCFFRRPAFPFKLVCLVSRCSRRSLVNLGGKSVGAEPRL